MKESLIAVRPDLAKSRKLVSVDIVSHKDLIDLNTKSSVTKVYLQVSINGTSIDFYAQNDFDAQRLVDELNYQNENSSLYILKSNNNELYAKNYFFTLMSASRLRRAHYAHLERLVADVFLNAYPQFAARNVSVLTTWQEEYVDETTRRIWYGLSILISVDNQPVDELITLDRNIFAQVTSLNVSETTTTSAASAEELVALPSMKFLPRTAAGSVVNYTFWLPRLTPDELLHPLAKAFTFVSNILICRRDFDRMETLIKRVIEDYKPGNSHILMIY